MNARFFLSQRVFSIFEQNNGQSKTENILSGFQSVCQIAHGKNLGKQNNDGFAGKVLS